MKLNKLTLKNFRCFEHLELDLHPQLTVLIGDNGDGKTTILDAARVALSPFVNAFKNQREYSSRMTFEDIRLCKRGTWNMEQQIPCEVEAIATLSEGGEELHWLQDVGYSKEGNAILRKDPSMDFMETMAARSDYALEEIREGVGILRPYEEIHRKIYEYANSLNLKSRGEQESVVLPLVCYFGIYRNINKGQSKNRNKINLSRIDGYDECLQDASRIGDFYEWYKWICMSYREEQLFALEENNFKNEALSLSKNGVSLLKIIEAIKFSINSLVKDIGWHDLEYTIRSKKLVMSHDIHGIMPIGKLSAGLLSVIRMTADIAYRAFTLNPHLNEKAGKETPGIVLIDEIDMHLHPKWQQTILKSLTDAFPKMQFIVTTHSPQVLSTVRRENIRILPEGKMPEFSPLAHESGDALAKIMNTPKQPPIELMDTVRAFEQLVRAGTEETEEAKKLRQTLDEKGYQIHESDLTTWRFLAKRKAQKGA
jgi:predicted ATP-binding protein involved in virulence